MHIELLAVIFVLTYLRHYMRQNKLYPEWDKKLSTAIVVVIVVFATQMVASCLRIPIMWLSFAALAWLANLIITKKEFAGAKPVLSAVVPFAAVSLLGELIKLISNSLYADISTYVSTAKTFAVIWMFAMWIIDSRQKKALQKEKLKTQQIEKEIIVKEKLKQALEQQVAERTAALQAQKEELQHALDELKSTQAQLIQSEKMASLGELTAGIAHEIQNPLNFVNNFSEVSIELAEELKGEIASLELHPAQVEVIEELTNTLIDNQQKINFHGKRADSIVKGMLQHSRSSSGVKEPVDINALVDEYLRLSYHGLRAKDKSFNAKTETHFEESLPKAPVIAQEVGRVLLNLFTNAFYSVMQKKKQLGESYVPIVTVTTRQNGNMDEVVVRDNGVGMPASVMDKIYNPFFTTKPAGDGTGLGLSISYDIITKAHGGTINASTKEGEFAEFIIALPIANSKP